MSLNNLKHEADNIRLTSAESSAMRARIFPTLQSGPRPQSVGVGSPYVFMSYHLRMTMAGLLLFILAGTGTVSAAAARALPGDLLYPIKVSVNEKVEVALAPTPAAKAQVQAQLAERRVDEAQTLASQGRLDKKTAETLTVAFDEHAAQAVALAEPDEQMSEVSSDNKTTTSVVVPQKPEPARAAATMAPQAATEATTSPEQEKQSDKKSDAHRGSIRESLRAKGVILQELKDSAPGIELQIKD